jgi:hypothetical protein
VFVEALADHEHENVCEDYCTRSTHGGADDLQEKAIEE